MKNLAISRDELQDVIRDSGIVPPSVMEQDLDFKDLMRERISNILLVSSRYDYYTLTDDGQLTEAIFSEYLDLNLHYAPHITRVYSGEAALASMASQPCDLVITMLRLGDMDLKSFSTAVKQAHPDLPVVLLAYKSRELQLQMDAGVLARFDRIFIWSGDRKLFLAIIKIFEDLKNAPVDCLQYDVRTVILVEDSPMFYSTYLPLIYTELIKQGQALIEEGRNFADKLLRQRARPKILHATTYEQAWHYYETYRSTLIGIITDLHFPVGETDAADAGLRFLRQVRRHTTELPILVQSSDSKLVDLIEAEHATFVDKYSRTLLQEVREFMKTNFGFGDFVFRLPDGGEVDRARTIRELRTKMKDIPDECLRYHASRDHFSNWLMARTRFRLASLLKPVKIDQFATTAELRRYLLDAIARHMREDTRGMIADFRRQDPDPEATFMRIGAGSLGGKARGLAFIDSILKRYLQPEYFPDIRVSIPRSIVLCTDIFASFVERNNLGWVGGADLDDDEVLRLFLEAEFPDEVKQDLHAIVQHLRMPLAVRSSSLLEDALYQPFAGIYATLMIPNADEEPEFRYIELECAIKYVYASAYFRAARNYIEVTGHLAEDEQMAVIIQQLAGCTHDHYFYPHISGVARSFNYYPFGKAKAADGVVNLALGLGRQIVEGGVSLQFCPQYPRVYPQFATTKDYFSNSQHSFFALDLHPDTGRVLDEDQNLAVLDLTKAEEHGTIRYLASTWSRENDTLYEGVFRKGRRILTFAPVLQSEVIPLSKILNLLMKLCQTAMNCAVEIEFAATLGEHDGRPAEFSFLQVRPMVKEEGHVDLLLDERTDEEVLLRSDQVLGNGLHLLRDIVYVMPDSFDASKTRVMAEQIDAINKKLVETNTPYLLIGPGRWGSSDPWLGIPVKFTCISGAIAIVETSLPTMLPDPSQGSHFFQNLTSFHIAYFTTRHFRHEHRIDWTWLDAQPEREHTDFVRHIVLDEPIEVRVDGRDGEGVIYKTRTPEREDDDLSLVSLEA
jgi:CheY-like chemotaxis protein